jgi:hypothetical protein
MFTRRQIAGLLLGVAATALSASARAQQVVLVERGSPEREILLNTVRAPVERWLGIRVIFVVKRLAIFGDWAYADLRPRTEAGNRIDYRRTRIANDFDPEQDSDTVGFLLRRKGASWTVVEDALLPTDVFWEEWQQKYKLPRALFFAG